MSTLGPCPRSLLSQVGGCLGGNKYKLGEQKEFEPTNLLSTNFGLFKVSPNLVEGQHNTTYLIPNPRFSSEHFQKKLEGKIVNVVDVNQWRCSEESGQCLH